MKAAAKDYDTAALCRYLRGNIPLAAAMDIDVVAADERAVRIAAPLAPNVNLHETAFGGSVASLAILASWSLLHLRLQADGIGNRLVIQRNAITYERPIAGVFSALASLASAGAWQPFVQLLQRRGKARIAVHAQLEYDGAIAARFEGEFVALTAG